MTVYEIQPGSHLANFDTARLQPGDIVRLLPGEHDLRRFAKEIRCSGTPDAPIVFEGTPGAYITRAGRDLYIYGLWVFGKHIEFRNLHIQDCAQSGIHIGGMFGLQRINAGHIYIHDCTFERCGHAVWVENDHVTIERIHARDGIMTRNSPGGDDDNGASLVMIQASHVIVRDCTAVNMIAPSFDYRFDGSVIEVYVGPFDIFDVLIERVDAYVANTFTEIGGWDGSTKQVGRITYRDCRLYAPAGGRLSSGVTWDDFQWGTFHIKGKGSRFGASYLAPDTVSLQLQAWNTQKAYHGDNEFVETLLNFRTGPLTEAEFFAARQPVPPPVVDPEPEPPVIEPTPEPSEPDTRYLMPQRGHIKLLFGEQVIMVPFEVVVTE